MIQIITCASRNRAMPAAAALGAALLCLTPLGSVDAQVGPTAGAAIEPDGTVVVPSFKLPPSPYLSEEAKKAMTRPASPQEAQAAQARGSGQTATVRAMTARVLDARIQKHSATYQVTRQPTTIAGVEAIRFTPPNIPAKNKGKILFNIPGGGFVLGMANGIGLIESIPVASLAQVEVVSITYRQAPEFKHPAAVEDIVKVYRELLKTYKPQNIGIYGCSAGGVLTAQALAWFQKEKLPTPRAAGIFCASADARFGGDSSYYSRPMAGLPYVGQETNPYLADADRDDPMISPYRSAEILRKFPPTLLITSTRAFDMSGAVNTHRELVKAGVESDLHVWDGFGHGFFYDLDLPESHEVFHVMAGFFGKHLGLQIKK